MARRINSRKDNLTTVINKMSEGNQEVVGILKQLIDTFEQENPNSCLPNTGAALLLDNAGVYGSDIEKLYIDSNENIKDMHKNIRSKNFSLKEKSELVLS